MIMAGITSCINTEEGGRRIKVKDDLKLQVKTKVKVDREEKGKTDRLILTSSTTPLEPSLRTSTMSKDAQTKLKANKTPKTNQTTKKNKMPKKKMKKRRKTKNHVSSAQKRSSITLEVFVGTRLASEYSTSTFSRFSLCVFFWLLRARVRPRARVEVESRVRYRRSSYASIFSGEAGLYRKTSWFWVSSSETRYNTGQEGTHKDTSSHLKISL